MAAKRAPLIGGYAKLVLGRSWSVSLREGLADDVQFTLRPGQPSKLTEAFADPHQRARTHFRTSADLKMMERVGTAGAPGFGGCPNGGGVAAAVVVPTAAAAAAAQTARKPWVPAAAIRAPTPTTANATTADPARSTRSAGTAPTAATAGAAEQTDISHRHSTEGRFWRNTVGVWPKILLGGPSGHPP